MGDLMIAYLLSQHWSFDAAQNGHILAIKEFALEEVRRHFMY